MAAGTTDTTATLDLQRIVPEMTRPTVPTAEPGGIARPTKPTDAQPIRIPAAVGHAVSRLAMRQQAKPRPAVRRVQTATLETKLAAKLVTKPVAEPVQPRPAQPEPVQPGPVQHLQIKRLPLSQRAAAQGAAAQAAAQAERRAALPPAKLRRNEFVKHLHLHLALLKDPLLVLRHAHQPLSRVTPITRRLLPVVHLVAQPVHQ